MFETSQAGSALPLFAKRAATAVGAVFFSFLVLFPAFPAAFAVGTASAESTLITNGAEQIGSFPTGFTGMPNKSFRINTGTVDEATAALISEDFVGPDDATLGTGSGWTRVQNESSDDDYLSVNFGAGFAGMFNGVEYSKVYVGSNAYFTFGDGSSEYSDLTASSPALPGVHICAADNSYQRVYYRFDDADTLRVRYEGTDSTGGTVGDPNMVYELVIYDGENYVDLHVGEFEACSDGIGSVEMTGLADVGNPLFVKYTGWAGIDYLDKTYQWQRKMGEDSYSDIEGATDDTYTPNAGDEGYDIRVVVTVSDELDEETYEVDASGTVTNEYGDLTDGDDDDRYDIASCDTLQMVNYYPELDYELTGNVDCSMTHPEDGDFDVEGVWSDGNGFEPIGNDEDWYTGDFYGNGFAIEDLYINRSGYNYVGLFSVIGPTGSVTDLDVNGDVTGNDHVGILAGFLAGTATGVDVTGDVFGNSYVGGLVGSHSDIEGLGSSSPLVFTWNGTEYQFVGDVGRSLPRNVTGEDPAPIDDGALVPKDGKYKVQISTEYNEINYYDEVSLMTFDHAPGYQVVTSLVREDRDGFFTIADEPSHPLLSCTDMYGNDCLSSLRTFDDTWSHEERTFLNWWEMDFGDLSSADRIQLVVRGARDYSKRGETLRFIQVKNASGEWVDAYDPADFSSVGGSPRNQVIDLTGRFLTDDYRVRVAMDRSRLNYFAVDTSAPVAYEMNELHPGEAELGFHGYSAYDTTYFWDHDYQNVSPVPYELFAPQIGNFTKYGGVTPLLAETDDQFVIMHHGDNLDLTFDYVAPAEGLERSFVISNWVTFKHADKETGQTVEPLPYNGMSKYPAYSYPMTPANQAYLAEWNTRVFEGIIGGSSTIIDSTADVDVEGDDSVGGLVGWNGEDKLISGSTSAGSVFGYSDGVGGLVGENYGDIEDSSSSASTEGGDDDVGGLVGFSEYGSITDSFATGHVQGDDSEIGGLVGDVFYTDITDSYATGNVEGDENVGGLAGTNESGTILRSYASGAVEAYYGDLGGLVGSNQDDGRVEDSYATGNVIGDEYEADRVGGLVGQNARGMVIRSYALGNVSGSDKIGGLVGANGGWVSDSFARGSATGSGEVGGLIGRSGGELVDNSYSTGVPTGGYSVGGLVGTQEGGDITDSFWDGETSGTSSSAAGTESGTEAMTDSTLFTGSGWDFSTVWAISEVVNDGYPYLQAVSMSPDLVDADDDGYFDIASCEDLLKIEGRFSSNFELTGDVDCSMTNPEDESFDSEGPWADETGFNPIGDDVNWLSGDFKGNGFSIDGLYINLGESENVGLFAVIGNSSEVSDLGVTNADVTGGTSVGILAGILGGLVTDSHVTGSVEGYEDVGGMVGSHRNPGLDSGDATIEDSYSEASVSGTNDVGGLVGDNDGKDITNSYATGTVDGEYNVGGLVGRDEDGDIEDSYATGNVSGTEYVGGLIGSAYDTYIEGSTASGEVIAEGSYAGGLIGGMNYGEVENSSATGAVSGSGYVGGLIGDAQNFGIYSSHATGTVNGTDDVGGLVGHAYEMGFYDAYATGAVTAGGNNAGGLVGRLETSDTYSGSYATGIVEAEGDNAGGLVGYATSDSTINDSYAEGEVTGDENVGGLVGFNESTAETSVSETYATGNASGDDNVGGLVGRNTGSVVNSFARGNASGIMSAGGLVGWNDGGLVNSYSTGTPSGESAGGLVGCEFDGVDGCATDTETSGIFWDVQTSGTEESDAGIGLSTGDMTDTSTFLDAEWDFESVWARENAINDGYPYLQSLPIEAVVTSSGGSSFVLPSAEVTLPNGGETVAGDADYTVLFAANGTAVTGVRVSFSSNGGSSWSVLATDLPKFGGYYNWAVPSAGTTNALIKVEAMGGTEVLASDVSNATFTITGTSSGNGGGGGDGSTTPPPGGSSGTTDDGIEGAGTSASGPKAQNRTAANGTLPAGVTVDALVKLPNDNNTATVEDSTVYYIGLDGKRHAFPTLEMYFSWYPDFSTVIEIDAASMAGIPLGGPILSRPGTKWVKISSDPKTYYVAPGYVLRWIQDEATATALWGSDWNTNIIDVSDALFVNFTLGTPIAASDLDTGWPSGSVIQDGDGVRWYVTASTRRMLQGSSFTDNLFQTRFVRTSPPAAGWMKTVGAPIVGKEDALFSLLH